VSLFFNNGTLLALLLCESVVDPQQGSSLTARFESTEGEQA
jgi:hypothetical protein